MKRTIFVVIIISLFSSNASAEVLWTDWFNRDRPFGYGDFETLDDLDVMCANPVAIDAETTDGSRKYYETGEYLTVDPSIGLVCWNRDQDDGECMDYRVRFGCAVTWTRWLDRDDPSGTGDWELLDDLSETVRICEDPLEVEGRTVGNHVPWYETGERLDVSPHLGLVCRNDDQHDEECQDYEVRFACPAVVTWTSWLDRDDPYGTGDWELLDDFTHVCDDPVGIDAQTVDGTAEWYQTGEILHVDPSYGLSCQRDEQEDNRCLDYRVRFACIGRIPVLDDFTDVRR